MAGLLTRYLVEAAGQDFMWAERDCAIFVAEWLDRLTGREGVADWRGRYHDEASCAAYIAANGGMVAIADAFIGTHYGMTRTAAAGEGNPVVVDYGGRQMMGLRVDGRDIAMRSEKRLFITPRAMVLAEWGPV